MTLNASNLIRRSRCHLSCAPGPAALGFAVTSLTSHDFARDGFDAADDASPHVRTSRLSLFPRITFRWCSEFPLPPRDLIAIGPFRLFIFDRQWFRSPGHQSRLFIDASRIPAPFTTWLVPSTGTRSPLRTRQPGRAAA